MSDVYEAWTEAVAALGPDQRLVLWQDRDGPQYVQVTAPAEPACEHEEEEMRPVISRLAAYPRHGLGDLAAELRSVAAELRSRSTPSAEPR